MHCEVPHGFQLYEQVFTTVFSGGRLDLDRSDSHFIFSCISYGWQKRVFGRIISREISSLEQVTENISQQELNFERKSSKVLEIDAVLQSMDQMREALKQSLHRQWNMEQVRREQMAALAHDIKTPLTILRGNAELTLEAEELAEVK